LGKKRVATARLDMPRPRKKKAGQNRSRAVAVMSPFNSPPVKTDRIGQNESDKRTRPKIEMTNGFNAIGITENYELGKQNEESMRRVLMAKI